MDYGFSLSASLFFSSQSHMDCAADAVARNQAYSHRNRQDPPLTSSGK